MGDILITIQRPAREQQRESEGERVMGDARTTHATRSVCSVPPFALCPEIVTYMYIDEKILTPC